MNTHLNTENWKMWEKANKRPNENTNYAGWQDTQNNRVVLYDSGADLVEAAEHNSKTKAWTGEYTKLADDVADQWTYGKHFPTLNLTKKALEEGRLAEIYLEQIESMREEIYSRFPQLQTLNEVAMTKRRRRRFSEDGDELDIDRYMCGDPCMFMHMPKTETKGRVARIFLDIAVSCGTDSMTITKNVLFGLCMCDIIERAGIMIEIIIGASSLRPTNDTRYYTVACMAKHADEPLDLQRVLSFSLPGFFRNYIFANWTHVNNGHAEWGLGTVTALNDKSFDIFNADVKFGGEDAWDSPRTMQVWMNGLESIFNIKDAALLQ